MIDIVPVGSDRRMLVSEEVQLRFRLFEPRNGRAPEETGPLGVLVFQPADGRQRQTRAYPVGGGFYEVSFPVPPRGLCYLFFSCPGQRLGYADLPYLMVQSSDKETVAVSRSPETADRLPQC
jgi:hypothetical protein